MSVSSGGFQKNILDVLDFNREAANSKSRLATHNTIYDCCPFIFRASKSIYAFELSG